MASPGDVAEISLIALGVRANFVSTELLTLPLSIAGVVPALLRRPLDIHLLGVADDAEALLLGPQAEADIALRRGVAHGRPPGQQGASDDENHSNDQEDDSAAGGDELLFPRRHHDSSDRDRGG